MVEDESGRLHSLNKCGCHGMGVSELGEEPITQMASIYPRKRLQRTVDQAKAVETKRPLSSLDRQQNEPLVFRRHQVPSDAVKYFVDIAQAVGDNVGHDAEAKRDAGIRDHGIHRDHNAHKRIICVRFQNEQVEGNDAGAHQQLKE